MIKGLEEFKEIEKIFEKSRKRNEPIFTLLWNQFTPSLQNRKLRIRGFLNTRPRVRGPGIPWHPMTVHAGWKIRDKVSMQVDRRSSHHLITYQKLTMLKFRCRIGNKWVKSIRLTDTGPGLNGLPYPLVFKTKSARDHVSWAVNKYRNKELQWNMVWKWGATNKKTLLCDVERSWRTSWTSNQSNSYFEKARHRIFSFPKISKIFGVFFAEIWFHSRKNTLVLFTSDHGDLVMEHRKGFSAIFSKSID